jgi:hypothetical protein
VPISNDVEASNVLCDHNDVDSLRRDSVIGVN